MMKANDLRPGDLFAYLVLSSNGNYEQHCRMLEGGRFRRLDTAEEMELRNPDAPVRLIGPRANDLVNTLPNGTQVRLSRVFVADKMQQAATALESLVSILHNVGLSMECRKVDEARNMIACLASGIDADAINREQSRRATETERMMQD